MLPSLGEASGFSDDYACKIILLYVEPCWDTCENGGAVLQRRTFYFHLNAEFPRFLFFLLVDGPIQEKFINDLFFPSKIGEKKETLTLLSPKGKKL